MPKSKASSLFVPTESPVPGVSFEVGTLLVQAIKARRKYLSKAYSGEQEGGEEEEDTAQKLQKLQNSADDKTKLFLNELKQNVQSSSSSSHKQQQHRGKKSTDAPQKCLHFLLEVLSNTDNSFHLRRSACHILKEILDKSSDARSYLASGQILLNFVSVIENAQETEQENTEENGTTSSSTGLNSMSPKKLFQLEAMEVIHNLASNFGQFYTQFTVASRLLGDVSVNFMHTNTLQNNVTHNNNESNSNQPQRIDMRMFRRDRDDALEYGQKACQSLERMIGRVTNLFIVLVPRFGGFNTADDPLDTMNNIDDDSKPTAVSMSNHKEEVVAEEDDDDSINWEEGDANESDEHDTESVNHTSLLEHHAAVNHTLDVMDKSGALLDGALAVQVKDAESGERKPAATSTSDLAAEIDQDQATVEARQKLQKIVQKLSTNRLPRLNKWIQALIHADGMQERIVTDPAAMGSEGQVSLVLISEEKRAIRGKLLQQMLKLKAEIEVLLKSTATLGIREDGTTEQSISSLNGSNSEAKSLNNSMQRRINPSAGIIRPSRLQSGTGVARKKSKKIKVTYNKR